MIRAFQAGWLALVFVLVGCASDRESSSSKQTRALPKLGDHHLKVTTSSAAAQAAFDRGLTLAYSFAHYAAEQEFRRAAALDTSLRYQ